VREQTALCLDIFGRPDHIGDKLLPCGKSIFSNTRFFSFCDSKHFLLH
jgi:hypothetical protein